MSIKVVPNTVVLTKPRRALTIDELISRYALSNEADGKSPKTIEWYNYILCSLKNYNISKGYKNNIASFNVDSARNYVPYLLNKPVFQGHPYTPERKTPLSRQTVKGHIRGLKAFSTWLYTEGITSENRLRNLKPIKVPVTLIEPLTHQEIKKISNSINQNSPTGLRNHVIYVTAIDSGLRASEIAGIKLVYLNLKEGHIKVLGKGAKERVVPIGKFVQMTLWHYVNKVRPKPANGDCDNLFLSHNGKPITVNTIKLMFTRLAKSSGVKRLHAHLCRHTFAINYLLNGGDIFSLKEILGHTTLDMVNHYLHFTSSQITAQHHKYSPMDKLQSEVEVGAI